MVGYRSFAGNCLLVLVWTSLFILKEFNVWHMLCAWIQWQFSDYSIWMDKSRANRERLGVRWRGQTNTIGWFLISKIKQIFLYSFWYWLGLFSASTNFCCSFSNFSDFLFSIILVFKLRLFSLEKNQHYFGPLKLSIFYTNFSVRNTGRTWWCSSFD